LVNANHRSGTRPRGCKPGRKGCPRLLPRTLQFDRNEVVNLVRLLFQAKMHHEILHSEQFTGFGIPDFGDALTAECQRQMNSGIRQAPTAIIGIEWGWGGAVVIGQAGCGMALARRLGWWRKECRGAESKSVRVLNLLQEIYPRIHPMIDSACVCLQVLRRFPVIV
jgi:hypothetical protein